jgi:hypothetical protein
MFIPSTMGWPAGRVAFAPRLGRDLTHGDHRACRCTVGAAGRPVACACDPADPESVRDALLAARQRLQQSGRGLAGEVARQAARFSPAEFAAAIGRVYAEALA